MKAFDELLSIKTFRETRAELAVLKQRRALASACEKCDLDAQTLEDFRRYAREHENDLFDDLCQRVVRLRDIEDVQQEVGILQTGERSREADLTQSEQDRALEQTHLDEARAGHLKATRMKQKFLELAQIYSEEAFKAFERKEDAEMEEIAELRRERIDWDEGHEEAA